jgi:hypothetical protein
MRNRAYIGVVVGVALLVLGIIALRQQKAVQDEQTAKPSVAKETVYAKQPPTPQQPGETAKPAVTKDIMYGSVTLPEAVKLTAADGQGKPLTIEPGKQTSPIPAGEYRIRSWQMERKDGQGSTWLLTGYGSGPQSHFTVSGGGPTKLDIGEPVVTAVTAQKTGSGGYSFSPVVKGRLGEYIELTRNGYGSPAPKLHVKNKDGTYDRTFNFAYG